MTLYDSSIPVLMAVVQTGTTYSLQLVSYPTGSPSLAPSDAVRASTTEALVSVSVAPGSGITITSVTTTGYRDAPELIPWNEVNGVFIGTFPAPEEQGEFIWDLVVWFTTAARTVHSLDPKMIVRKTNP